MAAAVASGPAPPSWPLPRPQLLIAAAALLPVTDWGRPRGPLDLTST